MDDTTSGYFGVNILYELLKIFDSGAFSHMLTTFCKELSFGLLTTVSCLKLNSGYNTKPTIYIRFSINIKAIFPSGSCRLGLGSSQFGFR